MTAIARRTSWPRGACRLSLILIAAVGMLPGGAVGQVRQVQGGNALDANPMSGAGGYNAARPVSTGINGNLIVTGNVTGGRSFRGYSPIQNPDTLLTGVPSAAIGDFVRDSVGLPSISAGLSEYSPRPYYNPASTAVTSGTVQNQALLPRQVTGTYSVNQYQAQMPVSPLASTANLGPIVPQLPNAAPTWQPTGTGMFRPDIMMGMDSPLSPYAVSSPAEVSGVRSMAGRDAGERVLPDESPLTQLIKPDLGEQPQDGPLSVQPSPVDGTPAGNLALLPRAADASTRGPARDQRGAAGLGGDSRLGTEPTAMGEDETSTLLTAMQRYTKSIQEAITPATPELQTLSEAAVRTTGDELLLLPPGMSEADRQRARADIGRREAAAMLDARLKGSIRTLAGMQQTPVDRQLAQAEDLMRREQYYRASQVYGGIIATDPDNPLAWLGRANALLAAGDYVSAYTALEQGVQRYPQMLQFNFDLPALVGNREILDVRRAEIEQTLIGAPNYRLRFLLGYLEYFAGLRELGLRTVQQAAEEAPADSVVLEAYRVMAQMQSPATQPGR